MSSFEVYQLVERRRHFLNLVYAMAIIATFQLCFSAGWYSYLSEAYYHLAYNSEHFFHCCGIFTQFIAICLLYMAMFVRRNMVIGFLIVIYFIQFALKLLQISLMYPDVKRRHKFHVALRHSEYDSLSMIHDSVVVLTSLMNFMIAACSAFYFTPLVLLQLQQVHAESMKMSNKQRVMGKTANDGTVLVMKSSQTSIATDSLTGEEGVNVNLSRRK